MEIACLHKAPQEIRESATVLSGCCLGGRRHGSRYRAADPRGLAAQPFGILELPPCACLRRVCMYRAAGNARLVSGGNLEF